MKKSKILFWIATTLLILWEAVMPVATLIFAPEYATTGTRDLFYPDYFAFALMVCKVLGIIAIALPQIPTKLKEWAYAGLTFNLLFASYSHAMVDKNIGFIILPLVVLGILAVSYIHNPKINNTNN